MNLHTLGPGKVFIYKGSDGDVDWILLTPNVEVTYFNFETFNDYPEDYDVDELESALTALQQTPITHWYRQHYEQRLIDHIAALKAEDE
jgi:hypothetical protein